jgi:hypothetical protein
MGTMKRKLTTILTNHFPEAEIKIEQANVAARVHGMIVWSGFEGVDQVDRQSRLWKVLRKHLSLDEQSKISAILTMAPVETLVG